MPGIRQRRKALLSSLMKDAIYEAAAAVLSEHGTDGTTMDRVAHQAGVAKGSLYNYFPTKQALLQFVHERATAPIRRQVQEEVLPASMSARQKLETMLRMWLRHLDQRRGLFNFLINDHVVRGLLKEEVETVHSAAIRDVAIVVEQGIAEGTFRQVEAHRVAELIFGAVRQVAELRLTSENAWPINDLTSQLMDFFLQGLLSQ